MKALIFTLAAAVCCSAVAQDSTKKIPVNIEKFHYGMNLDIAAVISTSVPKGKCSISPITMIYRDSEGNIKGVEYMTLSPGCEATNG